MLCYLDRTFCISDKCNCGRELTIETIKAARKWFGSDDAPIAMSNFCGGNIKDLTNILGLEDDK